MRKLIDTPNIEAATSDYPKGRVKDRVGATPGTTLNELGMGDLIQLAQKLIIDAAIVENDLPDNVTNGYQLLTALNAKINERTKVGAALTIERATAAFNSGTITIAAVTYDRMIYVYNGGTVSTTYGISLNVNGEQLSRIDDYQAVSYLLPAGLVSTIIWLSGTASELTVKSHKIGL